MASRALLSLSYRSSPRPCEVTTQAPLAGAGAAIAIDAKGWPDVVVWNPHTDMDCYKSFCCVENASFKPQSVAPGDSWRAQTEMEVVDLI